MAEKPEQRKNDLENQRLKKEEKARATRRRNRQIIGFALSILVVVGAVSIVIFAVNLVRSMMDTTDEYGTYQNLIEPLAWFNVLPFENVATIDEVTLKDVCLWGALSATPESERRQTEFGEPMVSVLEMEQYAISLFGGDFSFSSHEAFSDLAWGFNYGFNAETQMYILPPTAVDARFLPSVVDIQDESGGLRRVVVGYVNPRNSQNQVVPQPDYEHPAYYMDYMFRRDGNSYYLYALQPNTTYVPQNTSSEPVSASIPADDSIASSLPEDTSVASTPSAA